MKSTLLSLIWIGSGATVIAAGLVWLANGQSRFHARQVLEQNIGAPGAMQAAREVFRLEEIAADPDVEVIAKVWGILSGGVDEGNIRSAIEARWRKDLADELDSRSVPDLEVLRRAWRLAAVLGPEAAAEAHARIATRGGQRDIAALNLSQAAAAMIPADPGRSLDDLTQATEALSDAGSGPVWFTWAVRETPPVVDAIDDTEDALRTYLDSTLERGDQEQARRAWSALAGIGRQDHVSVQTVRRLAYLIRRDQVPWSGIATGVVVLGLLLLGLVLAVLRLGRVGPHIDPGAETIENVDPVDLDTDAVTVPGVTTGDETRTG